MADEGWRELGSCFGSFSNIFFPDSYGGKEAVEVCNSCIVTQPCLDWAVDTNQKDGVWGGMTYSQRVKYRRERDAEAPEIEAQGTFESATEEEGQVLKGPTS